MRLTTMTRGLRLHPSEYVACVSCYPNVSFFASPMFGCDSLCLALSCPLQIKAAASQLRNHLQSGTAYTLDAPEVALAQVRDPSRRSYPGLVRWRLVQLVPCRAAAPFFSTKLLPCSSCVLLVSVSSTAPSTPSACLRFAWARLTRCRLRGRADSGRCGRSASPGPLPFVGPEATDGHARLPDQKGRRNSRRCRRPASRYQPNAGCRGGETPSPLCPAALESSTCSSRPRLHQSSALSSLSPFGWTQVTHDYFSLLRQCHNPIYRKPSFGTCA